MKTIEVAHIDELDMKFVKAFQIVGMKEIEAKVLIHIINVKEATQRDIERYTDIQQSNVSIVTQTLIEKEYIKIETIKKGKGRPTKVYMLNMSVEEIVGDIQDNYAMIVESAERAIDILQTLK